jgi:hypothetical protein
MNKVFVCNACGKESAYRTQVRAARLDSFEWGKTKALVMELTNEARTYECVNCRSENRLEKSLFDWAEIDRR